MPRFSLFSLLLAAFPLRVLARPEHAHITIARRGASSATNNVATVTLAPMSAYLETSVQSDLYKHL